MAVCYLVQEEDGVSDYTLEDGSGFLLMEVCVEAPVGPPADGVILFVRRGELEDGLRAGQIIVPVTGRTSATLVGRLGTPAAPEAMPRGGVIVGPRTGVRVAPVAGRIDTPQAVSVPSAGVIVKPLAGTTGRLVRGRIDKPRTGGSA